MRILIFTQYYKPEPEPIPVELAKGMAKRGNEVTVITGFPNFPYGKIFSGYKQHLWQWETHNGVRILRLPLYPDHSLSAMKRSAYYLSFALSSTLLGPMLSGPADIVFIYHPITLAIPAWWIGLLRRIPFIVNIQDMYPESLTSAKMVNNNFLVNIIDKFTNFVYRRASAIAVISPGFKQNLIKKGVPGEKIHIIFNWVDESIYHPVSKDESLAEKFGMAGRFNIVYAGTIGPAQGLLNVIEAASMLSDLKDIQFVFIGDGLDKTILEKSVKDRNLENVLFLERQPASMMASFCALSDALLVHLINDPLFEITIPSKTQSCLACGRPLIMSLKGDATNLVLEAGAGIFARPSNPADLAGAVKKLYAMSPKERQTMGEAGRKYFLENLTMEIALEKYESLFKRVIDSSKQQSPKVSV